MSTDKNDPLKSAKILFGLAGFMLLLIILPPLFKTPKPWLTLESTKYTGNAETTYEFEIRAKDANEVTVNGESITCKNEICIGEIKLESTSTALNVVAKNKKHETDQIYVIERQMTIEEKEAKKHAEEEANRKVKEAANQKVLEKINREIKSIEDGINFSEYRQDMLGIDMALVLFSTWATMIEEGNATDDEKVVAQAKLLETKASAIQIREFPKLRQAYGILGAKKVWENDMDIEVKGSGNRTIEVIGYVFTVNRNIKQFHTEVRDKFAQLRFNRANYKWYDYDDEYTYYTMEVPDDGEVVIIE